MHPLQSAPEALARTLIEAALAAPVQAQLAGIEIHPSLDSTNAELLRHVMADPSGKHYRAPLLCLAEEQTGGRGRRGRHWHSPAGANLYWSLLWRFPQQPAQLPGLSVLTALGTAWALRELGVTDVGLKWPNDVLWRDRKLAGILLECSASADSTAMVAGIGLNVAMPAATPIDQAWTDLQQILQRTVSRNTLAAALLNQIVPLYQQVAAQHWPDLPALWAEYDRYAGQQVQLYTPHHTVHGRVQGIDQHGALLLADDQGVHTFSSGEVSLRRL